MRYALKSNELAQIAILKLGAIYARAKALASLHFPTGLPKPVVTLPKFRALAQMTICVTIMRAAKTGKSALFYSSLVATRVWFRTYGDILVVMDFVLLLECFIACFKMTLVAMCYWSWLMESFKIGGTGTFDV